MVGLGRLELPTSRLSGVRSNQLSYRPGRMKTAGQTGGAGRDRTGDLLSASQALSQLSYSPLESGKPRRRLYDNQRPAPIIYLILNRGRLDAESGTRPNPSKLLKT